MVTPQLVIDTSVVFKWFVAYGESGLGEAWRLLAAHQAGDARLIAPSTMPVEIANTLCYLVTPDDAHALLSTLEEFHVDLVDTSYDLVKQALGRAATTGMSVYDALFLALAEERGCPLVTADRMAFARVTSPVEIRLL